MSKSALHGAYVKYKTYQEQFGPKPSGYAAKELQKAKDNMIKLGKQYMQQQGLSGGWNSALVHSGISKRKMPARSKKVKNRPRRRSIEVPAGFGRKKRVLPKFLQRKKRVLPEFLGKKKARGRDIQAPLPNATRVLGTYVSARLREKAYQSPRNAVFLRPSARRKRKRYLRGAERNKIQR